MSPALICTGSPPVGVTVTSPFKKKYTKKKIHIGCNSLFCTLLHHNTDNRRKGVSVCVWKWGVCGCVVCSKRHFFFYLKDKTSLRLGIGPGELAHAAAPRRPVRGCFFFFVGRCLDDYLLCVCVCVCARAQADSVFV